MLTDPVWDQPLGLLYLGAVLEEKGFEVEVFDANFSVDWKDELKLHEADVYGVNCQSSLLKTVIETANHLKKHFPDSLRIVGGPHATFMPNDLVPFFDKIVVGEGEKAILEVLEGKWIGKLAHCPPIKDLDSIPFPARHLISIEKYHRKIDGLRSTGIITARGCPYSCVFCGDMWGTKARYRSAGNVLAEVEECVNVLDIKAFMFWDDTFTFNTSRLFNILDGLKRLDVKWRCLTRVDWVDEPTLEIMKNSGCVEILYGIESGSQKILVNIEKGTTVEQNIRAIDSTKKAGIPVMASIIVGCPGETWETIEETIRLLEEHPPDRCHVCMFTPFPGSPVWRHPEKYGVEILDRDFTKYQMLPPVKAFIRTKEMSSVEIEEAYEMVMNKVKDLGLK